MNSLGQIVQQFLGVWKQLGINQRISLVLAAGALFAGLGAAVYLGMRVDYSLLYGKLDDAEAAKVLAALDDAKVPYKMSPGGGAIFVPAGQVHQVRAQLILKGIPRASSGVGFEILDKPNFGISDFLQRANYLRAVQGELARTISQVDQIESASVLIAQPETRLVIDNQKRPTASVFLRVRGNNTLSQQTVNAVRYLVANAIEGLQPSMVSITDNSGNLLSDNNDNDPIAGLTATQLAARKNTETYLAKKAESMLESVLGHGKSVVRVSAEINYDTQSRTDEKFDPDSQVARTSTLNDESVDSSSPNSSEGGAAGTQSNSNTETNTPTASAATTSRTKKKVANTQFEINKSTVNFSQPAGGLKKLSAAVFVAMRYSTNADHATLPRTEAQLADLRKIVRSALGVAEADLQLVEIEFNNKIDPEVKQDIEKDQRRQFWTELASTAFYPALALLIFAFFWRILKRTQETIPLGIPLGHSNQSVGPKEPVITVDALNQMIRENPTNMTQAIRGWMAGRQPK